jgi:hypothetical protein
MVEILFGTSKLILIVYIHNENTSDNTYFYDGLIRSLLFGQSHFRLGIGDNTYNGMKTMLQKYQNYPNGCN